MIFSSGVQLCVECHGAIYNNNTLWNYKTRFGFRICYLSSRTLLWWYVRRRYTTWIYLEKTTDCVYGRRVSCALFVCIVATLSKKNNPICVLHLFSEQYRGRLFNARKQSKIYIEVTCKMMIPIYYYFPQNNNFRIT